LVVVVGGHSRKIGKSSVVAGLIRPLRRAEWTAIKVTAHLHDADSVEAGFVVHEEAFATSTDSGRYLAAGAVRSFWISASSGAMERAAQEVRRIAAAARNTIIESNSILEFLEPDLFLVVIDPTVEEWKDSARRQLKRADALVVVGPNQAPSSGLPLAGDRIQFTVLAPDYESPDLVALVEQRLN
jgi:hypothetical protein